MATLDLEAVTPETSVAAADEFFFADVSDATPPTTITAAKLFNALAAVCDATAVLTAGGTTVASLATPAIRSVTNVTYLMNGNYTSTNGISFATTKFGARNDVQFGWYNTDPSGTFDTGVKRIAAKVIGTTDGSTGAGWLQNTAGLSRVSSDVTNTGTTLAAVTGLSATVIAGRKYSGRLVIFCDNSVAAEGVKLDFNGGTATWTSFRAAFSSNVQGATLGTTVSAAIATVLNATALNGTGVNCLVVEWAGVCNAAGTFIPQAAKDSTGGGGTLTVRTDSNMTVEDYP